MLLTLPCEMIFQTPHSRICSSLRRVKLSRVFLSLSSSALVYVSPFVFPAPFSSVWILLSSVVLLLLVPSVPLSFPPVSFRGNPCSTGISIVDFGSRPIVSFRSFVYILLCRFIERGQGAVIHRANRGVLYTAA